MVCNDFLIGSGGFLMYSILFLLCLWFCFILVRRLIEVLVILDLVENM